MNNNFEKWIIVIVSAITDAGISIAAALTAAMASQDKVAAPSEGAITLALIGGLAVFMRTIQQHLKKFTEE